MILYVNYEELTALQAGARVLLEHEAVGEGAVLAPLRAPGAGGGAPAPARTGDLSRSTRSTSSGRSRAPSRRSSHVSAWRWSHSRS